MTTFRAALVGFASFIVLASSALAANVLDTASKTALQAGMQQFIERSTVNGVYLHLDLASGNLRSLHPVNAHPMILRMGENFVLCGSFRDAKGNTIPVDYYMTKRGNRYIVFQAEVENRDALHKLMDAGKVVQAD